jgi:ketosteroid isomerase-like protein
MSQENVEIMRRGFDHFAATGDFLAEIMDPGFVWNMSTFRGWPERQTYAGIQGARRFIADWTEPWEDWELDLEALRDAGDRVVAITRQRGRSTATGITVELESAQVWTLREGKQVRMDMYASPAEALEAAGLSE